MSIYNISEDFLKIFEAFTFKIPKPVKDHLLKQKVLLPHLNIIGYI